MSPEIDPIVIEWFDEVESTQAVARQRVEAGLDGPRAFAAAVQTKGYGRHGRVWQSPEGGLWMTIALPSVAPEVVATAGVRAGVACGEVVESLVQRGGGSVELKWPNDVLVEGRKVCGVLCESISHAGRGWLLVGIGINANNRPGSLAGHLRRPAAALVEWTNERVDVPALAQATAQAVAGAMASPLQREVLEWAARRLWRLDRRVAVRCADGSRADAVVRGLSERGELMVEIDGRRGTLPPGSEIMDSE